MFTGIVEEIGHVDRISTSGSAPLKIQCRTVLDGTRIGDSIAVNGICLTVTDIGSGTFSVDVQPVTRRLTNLGGLRSGDPVNLERSVGVGQRFGGHYVQGHVDGVARIVNVARDGASLVVRLDLQADLLRYVVERGFISVDGASLTVVRLWPDGVDVSLVYHTQQSITLPGKRAGDWVNIETDVFAKYVERLAGARPDHDATMNLLRRAGFA